MTIPITILSSPWENGARAEKVPVRPEIFARHVVYGKPAWTMILAPDPQSIPVAEQQRALFPQDLWLAVRHELQKLGQPGHAGQCCTLTPSHLDRQPLSCTAPTVYLYGIAVNKRIIDPWKRRAVTLADQIGNLSWKVQDARSRGYEVVPIIWVESFARNSLSVTPDVQMPIPFGQMIHSVSD